MPRRGPPRNLISVNAMRCKRVWRRRTKPRARGQGCVRKIRGHGSLCARGQRSLRYIGRLACPLTPDAPRRARFQGHRRAHPFRPEHHVAGNLVAVVPGCSNIGEPGQVCFCQAPRHSLHTGPARAPHCSWRLAIPIYRNPVVIVQTVPRLLAQILDNTTRRLDAGCTTHAYRSTGV